MCITLFPFTNLLAKLQVSILKDLLVSAFTVVLIYKKVILSKLSLKLKAIKESCHNTIFVFYDVIRVCIDLCQSATKNYRKWCHSSLINQAIFCYNCLVFISIKNTNPFILFFHYICHYQSYD